MSLDAIPLNQIFDAAEIQEEYSNCELIDYEGLRQELASTGIALQEDPIEGGLTKLNGLIAQIDAQKTRVANIVNQAIRNESDLEVLFKKVLGIYKREFDFRLPQPPCIEFTNAAAREAACNSLLGDLMALKLAVEGSYAQAKTFTKMAYNDLAKLDSTNKNISRQITVLQLSAEIGEIQRSAQPSQHTF